MARFSVKSEARLATCHPDLQRVAREAIKRIDFTVLCGHRGEAEQDEAYLSGRSQLPWPKSRHNKMPSEAMDLAPYPINWENLKRFRELAKVVLEEAAKLGVDLEWGGTCFGDFIDMPHFQLKKK